MANIHSEDEITAVKLKQIRAKRQFKALVRLVIANRYWINAEPHLKSEKLQVIQKRTGKRLLTIEEKSILKTPPELRTESDVNLLYKVLGYLRCFKNYPEDVTRALVAHTTYEYFPANRVIVRQNAPSWAMYFIIAGQLQIVVKRFVEELEEEVVVTQSNFNAGDTFGDASLLHDTPRTATVTTQTHCELLVLQKYHFDKILRNLTLERWQLILDALQIIPFFEDSNFYAKKELCVMSHLKTFKRNEIILGDGNGKAAYVHFIVKGFCKLIEHIPLRVEYKAGLRIEKLYTAEDEMDQSSRIASSLDENKMDNESLPIISSSRLLLTETSTTVTGESKSLPVITDSRRFPKKVSIIEHFTRYKEQRASVSKIERFSRGVGGWSGNRRNTTATPKNSMKISRPKSVTIKLLAAVSARAAMSMQKRSIESGSKMDLSSPMRHYSTLYPPDVIIRFVEVCSLGTKSVFGLGERFYRRRVVAANEVTCLLVPSYWLLPQSNVWNLIRDYIDRIIPNNEAVYRIYKADRKFQKFKKNYINSLVKKKKVNTIHNVPYSIRIREDMDYEL